MPYDTDQLISTARKRLSEAKQADEHNRAESETDLLFRVLQQWDDGVRDARVQSSPPRPCITVDRLGAFCNQVTNEVRQSKPAPKVSPRGSAASKETATVIEGMVRSILYDSDSELAFQEAVKYAVCSGMGAFRLDPEMVDEETNQQKLCVNPIYDPSTVWWDPFSKRPDKADARWCLVIQVMSRIEYRERWPDSQTAMADFTNRDWPGDWMDPRGDGEAVMVAEYWCIETNDDDVAMGAELDDPLGSKRVEGKAAKPKPKRVVMHLINGVEELEPPTERPGKYLPIFAVEGDAFWVKGKRYLLSLIRSARDIQRLYNWEATKEVEMLAMQATSPYLVTPRMVQNHENQWQDAPNKNFFYLKFNPDPEAPGGPQRQNAEAPIQALSQAKAMTAQEIKDVIGLQDPNLGRAQSPQQSGIAIQQLRTEGDVATYHYTDNLSRTLKHFCRVLTSWIPYYYDVEQEMKILQADMTTEMLTINSPQPVAHPETGKQYQHDLTKGDYETVVDVGPGFDTARKEESNFMSSLIQAVPDAFWIIGDIMIRNRDSVGAEEAADRIKRAIALKLPGLIQDPNQQSQLPPQVQTQIQAMGQQLQQLQQVVQSQAMEIKSRVQPKLIEAQSKERIANVNAQTAIAKALLDLKGKIHQASLEHGHAMYDTTLREATDAVEHLMGMLHESELAPTPQTGPPGLHPAPPPMPGPAGPTAAPGQPMPPNG